MIFDSNRRIVKVYYLFTWIKEKGRKSIKVETKGRKEEREAFKTSVGPEFRWNRTLSRVRFYLRND